jgi:eukaryotic-like serine/threonine-protein kinase
VSRMPEGTAGDDALRDLCFSDAVFRQRYRGWWVLGQGSFATVVRTFSQDAARDVALKIFVNLQADQVQRIREEVRAAQSLTTPYLVQAYSLFDHRPITWFEMELVEGPSLQQALDGVAGLGEHVALPHAYDIALAVSRGLWYAHRHGVLHRDLKPANILLPASGQPAAKLADLGIARVADAGLATPKGSIVGTPLFASPEALAGRPVGTAHDIFGLCATLYALFAGGALPYSVGRDEPLATLRRLQVEKRARDICELVPDLDATVGRLIMRGLSLRPFRRPNVERIVLALERAQARLTERK